jgi:uncharacterized repeat protein (TIGR01451 family)
VNDPLPGGNNYVSHTNPPGTTATITPGGGQLGYSSSVEFVIPALAPGEAMIFTVTVNIAAANSGGGCAVYLNQATVSMDQVDANPDNNTSTVDLDNAPVVDKPDGLVKDESTSLRKSRNVMPCPYDIGITKAVHEINGDEVTFVIAVTNQGPNSGPFDVTDQLPDGVTYVSSSSDSASVQMIYNSVEHAVTFYGDYVQMAPGDVVYCYVTVHVNTMPPVGESMDIVNTASMTGYETWLNESNNTASATATVIGVPDLNGTDIAVTKAVYKQGLTGSPISYLITVVNNGPNTATNVVVEDHLANIFTFQNVSASPGSASYNPMTHTVTYTIPSLAPGATGHMTLLVAVNVIPPAPISVINKASLVSMDQNDTNLSNNSSTAYATIPGKGGIGGDGHGGGGGLPHTDPIDVSKK